jgi:hypothetical protein
MLVLQHISFMHSFYMFKAFGPKIIMILEMVSHLAKQSSNQRIIVQLQLKDLFFFMGLFMIFLLSFGVALQSLVYPDDEISWDIVHDALYSPFFDMLGNTLTLDRVAGCMHTFTTKKHIKYR